MYSTYTHGIYNSSKGETHMYSGSLLPFFLTLLAITVIFSICCDLRLLYDTSKDDKIKE